MLIKATKDPLESDSSFMYVIVFSGNILQKISQFLKSVQKENQNKK